MRLLNRFAARWGRDAIGSRVLVTIALLGAPLAWTVHFLLSWAIAEWSGPTASLSAVFLGVTARIWLLIAVSVISILASVGSTVIAHLCVRSGINRAPVSPPPSSSWAARTGIFNGYIFTFVIAFETIPVLFFLRDR